ncbi:MAG: molecular chaperone SurA [Betaproteobacteria bacterium]|nr:molecular chaperone SurA [Betaproteobacteria bacterium]PWB60925.1 MAG: molecular chaperone SurA [Betaproteobacteria bacterium]
MNTIRLLLRTAALAAALAATAALAQSAPASRLETRLAAPPKNVVLVDRIVAVVNDEVVTSLELAERTRLVAAQLRRGGGALPPTETLQRQVLERMINDLVQVQMAKETGIKVDEPTIEKTIQRIADDNNMSMTAFRQALERDGVRYARFREDMKNELLLTRLREREVENSVVVTDAEVETELARAAKERGGDVEYQIQHVLVLLPQQATPEQIDARRRKALQALSEVRKGTSFAEVAATFSDAPDALQGGNLGWRPAGRLPGLFLDAIEKLNAGEVTDILRSPNGFHIVKLLEKRGAGKAPSIVQTRARHILLRTKEGTSDSDLRTRIARIRERIASGEDFAELARVNSEDGTAARGGDLGWIGPGDTVPEFERAMNSLKEGELSQPIQTPFGWHIVQVQERRNEEMSEDRRKLAARQTVRARKADEAYSDWLRQARDRAFVENRLDER